MTSVQQDIIESIPVLQEKWLMTGMLRNYRVASVHTTFTPAAVG